MIDANLTSITVRTQLNDALHTHALGLAGLERATAGAFRASPDAGRNEINPWRGGESKVDSPPRAVASLLPKDPMTSRPLFGFSLALAFATSMPVAAQPVKENAPIQIGLVKQFFNDVDPVFIGIATQPFGDLMKDATGFQGELHYKYGAFEIAQKLDKGNLQIGVFHGHEYAWLQKVYPKLRPLMLAVNQHNDVRAFIVVNKNNPATNLGALRGKTIDVPMMTKEHCCLYLEKACRRPRPVEGVLQEHHESRVR